MNGGQRINVVRVMLKSPARGYLLAGIVTLMLVLAASPVIASEPEDCLWCHRLPGLGWIDPDTGELRLFTCDSEHYSEHQGPHADLPCTGCHVREEVEVIPHRVQTPVDCTRQCHTGADINAGAPFSHQSIARQLDRSAHGPEALADLPFDPPLLRQGQSSCLYCHDQPVFRQTKPTRSARRLAQLCALCHSDAEVIARTDSHDAVASYLHSFHGKANLLGSTETATCLDCHTSEPGEAHAVLAEGDPASSIHKDRLATTCRSADCHAGASPKMSQAAVHLDLDPQDRTPEFYVAAVFIILTASVMSVFFLLIMLQLLNVVLRRRDPEHERLVRLARKLKRTPEGRKILQRATPHERVQHWVLAITFILLVATGMPIKFAGAEWASKLVSLFGGLSPTRQIHRVSAVIMMAAFLYHLGYLALTFARQVRRERRRGNTTSLLRTLWNAPTVLKPADCADFARLFAYLLFLRRQPPAFKRFNFVQKFEYWAVFWGIPIMALSGLALGAAASVSAHISGRGLNFAYIIHSDESYLAFIYIAVVHIFSVVLNPSAFPLSPGTMTGQARAAELAESHRHWLESAARQLGFREDTASPPGQGLTGLVRQVTRRVYAAGLLCACAAVCFISMRFLFTLLLTRQTAPVELVEVPRRLDAAMLTWAASPDGRLQTDTGDTLRPPPSHFHLIASRLPVDPGNNCTTSGCHTLLPHSRRIAASAFLNMHTTFVDCYVCHSDVPNTTDGRRAAWFAPSDRKRRESPASLPLLEQPSDQRDFDARIGLLDDDRLIGEPTADQQRAATRYLNAQDAVSDSERHTIMKTIHQAIEPVGPSCTACHSAAPTHVDFAELGYPPERTEALKDNPIALLTMNTSARDRFGLPLTGDAGPGHATNIEPPADMTVPDELPLTNGRITCRTCHAAAAGPRSQTSADTVALRVPNDRGQLCLACHHGLIPDGEHATAAHMHPQGLSLTEEHQLAAIRELETQTGPDNELTCLSCHKVHDAAAADHLLAVPQEGSRLCVACHPDHEVMAGKPHDLRVTAPQELNRRDQTAEQSGPCGACHNVHAAARQPAPNRFDPEGMCATCHDDGQCALQTGYQVFDHPVEISAGRLPAEIALPLRPSLDDNARTSLTCLTCHEPHNEADAFLRMRPDELCATCHNDCMASLNGAHDLTNRPELKNALGASADTAGKCGFCHTPHNASGPMMWAATAPRLDGADDLCLGCHTAGGKAGDRPYNDLLHPSGPETAEAAGRLQCKLPLFDKNAREAEAGFVTCSSCHDVHADEAETPDLLRKGEDGTADAACFACHRDTQPIASSLHHESIMRDYMGDAGMERSASLCGPCHAVHALPGISAVGTWSGPLGPEEHPPDVRKCTGCHGPDGHATPAALIDHPAIDVDGITQIGPDAQASLPIVSEQETATTGRVTCTTCHLPHGRPASRGLPGIDPANLTPQQHRGLRPMLRPYVAPNICSNCHGFDGLRLFLYYHDEGRPAVSAPPSSQPKP